MYGHINTDFSQGSHPYAQQTPLGLSPRGHGQGGPTLTPALSNNLTGSTSMFSTLRVKVADEYRIPPPVDLSHALENVPETNFQFNLDFERKIVQGGGNMAEGKDDFEFADPWQAKKEKFNHHDFSESEIGMAFTACKGDNEEEVVSFVQNYRSLTGMGFLPDVVVGALIRCKGNLQAALDLLSPDT